LKNEKKRGIIVILERNWGKTNMGGIEEYYVEVLIILTECEIGEEKSF